MKQVFKFAVRYKLFSIATLTVVAGIALHYTKHNNYAQLLLSTVAILESLPLVYSMWQDFRTGSYGLDVLAITAIVASVALGQYWAAIVVVLMLTGGESLEDYAERRAQRELDALLKHAPQIAHVIRKGKTLDVKVNELHVGDKILIKPGEIVPVDSVIIEGTASFDEASLTGESIPQSKDVGDKLLSGSITLDGAVTAKVTATAADSQYQQIIKLVKSASASQAPFVRLADRYSLPFSLAAYAIAITVWIMTGHAIRFLEVIIVATPCPLLLAAPIALISGMSRASKYGIIVKTGSALEKLSQAKSIAFDKTGTLTRGQLKIDSVESFGKFKANEVLGLAASLELSSNHVMAQAIVDGAKAKKIKLTKAKHVREISGRGIMASIKSQQILVGRLSLLEEHKIKMPKEFKPNSVTQTAVYVAVAGEFVGVIKLSDELRLETKATLARLHKLGLKDAIMITGDNLATANKIAKELGIDHVHADTLPAQKLHILESIKDRPLIFVGDGVNDAPALTASDVGIALGARGSTAASESADMVIMLDDLGRVATAVAVAKRTFFIAKQSILIGIGISLGLMVLFATGKFSPLLGALLQEVVDVVVIFNALRAHTGKLQTV
jgi:heavy metal translocating P-type ATPase